MVIGWVCYFYSLFNFRHLFSCGDDGFVHRWNFEKNSGPVKFAVSSAPLNCLSISNSSKHFAVSGDDRIIRIFPNSGLHSNFSELKGHFGKVRDVDFSPDDSLLVSGADDKIVRVWSIPTHSGVHAKTIHTFTGHKNWIRVSKFTPDGRMIITAADDRCIKLWDTSAMDCSSTIQVGTSRTHALPQVRAASISPDGTTLCAGLTSGNIKIWDLRARKPLQLYEAHTGEVASVDFSLGGKLLVSGGRKDGLVRIWDLTAGKLKFSLYGHDTAVGAVGVNHANGCSKEAFASGGLDGLVLVWGAGEEGGGANHEVRERGARKIGADNSIVSVATRVPSQSGHVMAVATGRDKELAQVAASAAATAAANAGGGMGGSFRLRSDGAVIPALRPTSTNVRNATLIANEAINTLNPQHALRPNSPALVLQNALYPSMNYPLLPEYGAPPPSANPLQIAGNDFAPLNSLYPQAVHNPFNELAQLKETVTLLNSQVSFLTKTVQNLQGRLEASENNAAHLANVLLEIKSLNVVSNGHKRGDVHYNRKNTHVDGDSAVEGELRFELVELPILPEEEEDELIHLQQNRVESQEHKKEFIHQGEFATTQLMQPRVEIDLIIPSRRHG